MALVKNVPCLPAIKQCDNSFKFGNRHVSPRQHSYIEHMSRISEGQFFSLVSATSGCCLAASKEIRERMVLPIRFEKRFSRPSVTDIFESPTFPIICRWRGTSPASQSVQPLQPVCPERASSNSVSTWEGDGNLRKSFDLKARTDGLAHLVSEQKRAVCSL